MFPHISGFTTSNVPMTIGASLEAQLSVIQ